MPDDEPDWESIARQEVSSTLEAMLETEIVENAYPAISAINNGEPVDDSTLDTFRSRVYEFDERLTYFRSGIGEIDIKSPEQRLHNERRALHQQFHRLARSARQDKLCQHELDAAREELERAQQTLDDLEAELEE